LSREAQGIKLSRIPKYEVSRQRPFLSDVLSRYTTQLRM
jgi:hypothetical protein